MIRRGRRPLALRCRPGLVQPLDIWRWTLRGESWADIPAAVRIRSARSRSVLAGRSDRPPRSENSGRCRSFRSGRSVRSGVQRGEPRGAFGGGAGELRFRHALPAASATAAPSAHSATVVTGFAGSRRLVIFPLPLPTVLAVVVLPTGAANVSPPGLPPGAAPDNARARAGWWELRRGPRNLPTP